MLENLYSMVMRNDLKLMIDGGECVFCGDEGGFVVDD